MSNITEKKSYEFAVRIVKLYKHLSDAKKEYVMAKQILKSGTSIGANVAEAEQAQSRADFISKMNIALKEAVETDYWIRLLCDTGFLTEEEKNSILPDCKELERLLTSIIKNSKPDIYN